MSAFFFTGKKALYIVLGAAAATSLITLGVYSVNEINAAEKESSALYDVLDTDGTLAMLSYLSSTAVALKKGDSPEVFDVNFPGFTVTGFSSRGSAIDVDCVEVKGFPSGPLTAKSDKVSEETCIGDVIWTETYATAV